jgi:anti-sigma factor ChrR (cupin superfamily)
MVEGPLVVANLFDREKLLADHEWKPLHKDVFISMIYTTGKGSSQAALIHYLPGSSIPVHRHPGFEHILILHGAQQEGSHIYRQGTLVIQSPDSQHQIASPEGCIALGVWEKPVEFLP